MRFEEEPRGRLPVQSQSKTERARSPEPLRPSLRFQDDE